MKNSNIFPFQKKLVLVALCLFIPAFLFAQVNNTSSPSTTSVGLEAGTEGTSNTFIGYRAGKVNTTGWQNTFLGTYAGYSHTTGTNNVFLGTSAGYSLTTGGYNIFIGRFSGRQNISGKFNVSIGDLAGYHNTGSNNVFLGKGAGQNETGSNKLYISNSSTSTPLIYGDFSTMQLGINARPSGTHTLSVGGSIISEEVVVKLQNNWPDFVFEKEYNLPSLTEVESFIKENKHLPNIPSEVEVQEKGINVEEITVKLLQKIEELTLYMIELKKENEFLKAEINSLK